MLKKVFVLLLLSALCLGTALAQADYGQVTKIDGTLIKSTDAGDKEMSEGEIIFMDDTLKTGAGSYAEVRFRGRKYLIDESTEFTLRQITTPPRTDRKNAAKIDYIVGVLELIEQTQSQVLRVGELLKVGDVVKTGDNSYAELLYGDKVMVKVAENTTLEIKEFEEKKKTLKQLLGRIWVKARKLVAEKFEVETRFGTAGVRGTSFGVSVDSAGGLDIDCEEGLVYMRTPAGEEMEIPAGSRCGIRPDGTLKDMVPRDEKEGFESFGGDDTKKDDTAFLEALGSLKKMLASIEAEPTEEKIVKFLGALKELERTMPAEYAEHPEYLKIKRESGIYISLIEKISALVASVEKLAAKLLEEPEGEQYEQLISELQELKSIYEKYAIFSEKMKELESAAEIIRKKLMDESTQEKDENILYMAMEKEILKWEALLSVKTSVVDFRLLEMNINRFDAVAGDLIRKTEEEAKRAADAGLSQWERQWDALSDRLENLQSEGRRLREIVKFENYVYSRVSATREKIYTFKQELEAFSSYTDSASLWIEQAVNAVNTGENLIKYSTEARTWYRLGTRYEGLRAEFSSYENLIEDAKRRGIFYTSSRILKEYEEIVKLTNGFKVKKGCCLVTMNFGQLRRIFILLKNFFMTSDGRSLL